MSALFEKLFSLTMARTFMGIRDPQTELYVVTSDFEGGGIRGDGLSNDNADTVKLSQVCHCLPRALQGWWVRYHGINFKDETEN